MSIYWQFYLLLYQWNHGEYKIVTIMKDERGKNDEDEDKKK